MRTKWAAVVLAAGAMASGGCATKTGTGALAGGGIGAGLGAAVGSVTGNAGAGAAIGGALGAVTGGAIGNAADAEDRERRNVQQASAAAQAHAQQSRIELQDVVRMTMEGQSEAVIINQIRSSGTTYQLSASDLSYLKTNGVTDRVIIEMQNARGSTPVIVSPRPRHVVVHEPPPVVVVQERRPPPVVFMPPPPPPRPAVYGAVFVR